MSKNPILNAVSALLYIIAIATLMTFGTRTLANKPDPIFIAPVAMLSLFTFSAGVMGYLFCAQPIMLYLDGKKKQAVNFFLRTLLTFGAMTLVILIIMFSGIVPGKQ